MSRSESRLPKDYYLYGDRERDVGQDSLNIEELRQRSSQHDWIIRPHFHPNHIQLMLFTSGGAETRIENIVLEPRAGTLVVHPVGTVHEIRYLPGTEGMTITVAVPYVESLLREETELSQALLVPQVHELGSSYENVAAAFTEILGEFRNREQGWSTAIKGRFQSLLVQLHRLQRQMAQPVQVRRDLQLALGLRDLIEVNFRQKKHMTFYARKLAISPQRLNAACKSALGCPASQVLHDRIMVEARRLLTYTELTVAEVGHDLGFDDSAYFNRFFAKRAGQSPGAWRAVYSATRRVEGKAIDLSNNFDD